MKEKRVHFLYNVYFVRGKHLCFISMYSILNILSEYACFFTSKNIIHTFFCLFLKSSKAFNVSLRILAKHFTLDVLQGSENAIYWKTLT